MENWSAGEEFALDSEHRANFERRMRQNRDRWQRG